MERPYIKFASPAYIQQQRALGWPDIHPEDYSHICGIENPVWYADNEPWNLVVNSVWHSTLDHICCPTCFVKLFEKATGEKLRMHVRLH